MAFKRYYRYQTVKPPYWDDDPDPNVSDSCMFDHIYTSVENIPDPDAAETLHFRITTNPPHQHICLLAIVCNSTICTLGMTAHTELGRRANLDERLLAFILEQLEEAPLFLTLEDQWQDTIRQFVRNFPTEYETCHALSMGEEKELPL